MNSIIPQISDPVDLVVLVIHGILTLLTIILIIPRLFTVSGFAAILAAICLSIISIYKGSNLFWLKDITFWAKSSDAVAFFVGLLSSSLVLVAARLSDEPIIKDICVFAAALTLLLAIQSTNLVGDVAIAGAAGKAIGYAIGGGLISRGVMRG